MHLNNTLDLTSTQLPTRIHLGWIYPKRETTTYPCSRDVSRLSSRAISRYCNPELVVVQGFSSELAARRRPAASRVAPPTAPDNGAKLCQRWPTKELGLGCSWVHPNHLHKSQIISFQICLSCNAQSSWKKNSQAITFFLSIHPSADPERPEHSLNDRRYSTQAQIL